MKERVVYLDYLRVFATIAIVVLHAAATCWGTTAVNSLDWHILNVFESITRWGVPVFVMISGALFLDRDISLKSLLSKNILRLAVSYIVWGFVYAVFSGGGIKNIIIKTFWGYFHMWFIPMMIGLYLCLPMLKKIAESEKIAKYFLMLSFIFTFLLPWVMQIVMYLGGGLIKNIYAEFFGNMRMFFVAGFPGYFLLGYMLRKNELIRSIRRTIYVLGIIGFISTVVLCYFSCVRTGAYEEFFYGPMTVNVLLQSIAVFVWFKHHSPHSEKVGKIVKCLSKYCFGVYLIHVLLIQLLKDQFGISAITLNPVVAVPVIAIVVCVASFIVSWILNKIPVLNKYIV